MADIQISSDPLQLRALPRGMGMVIAATASVGLWMGFFRLVGLV